MNRCKLCSRQLNAHNTRGYCTSNYRCRRAADRQRYRDTSLELRGLARGDGGATLKRVFRRTDRVTIGYKDGWCVYLDGREVSIHGSANAADAVADELRKRVRNGMVQRAAV